MELNGAVEVLRDHFGFVVGLDMSLSRAYFRCYEPPVPKDYRLTPPNLIVWRDLREGSDWWIETAHPQRNQILAILNRPSSRPDRWNDPYFN
jgi:hypothetical protein